MSKLDKLLGENKDIVIGGVEFTIQPLPLKHLDLFLQLEDDAKRSVAIKKIITETLKLSVPEASDEEIDKVGIKFFKELIEAILDVNGLKDVNKKPTG
jgi:hypothetical protein